MLVIRGAQFAAFQQNAVSRFAAEAAEHLLKHFPGPSAALGDESAVLAFVERGIEKAAKVGVQTKGAVTILLELWVQFGENFQRSPLREFATNILAHPVLPGQAKADLIRERHQELTGGCVMVTY